MTLLTTQDLVRLVQGVFRPRPEDSALAILVDLPDDSAADTAAWAARRRLATEWCRRLREGRSELGLEQVDLVLFRNTHRNNAEFPAAGFVHEPEALPDRARDVGGGGEPFAVIYDRYSILMAPTQFSATAPLKVAARHHGFRAATMPGFNEAMIPALRVDYDEVARRCDALKVRLDAATGARLVLQADGREDELRLDLRHRTATASGGRMTEPGMAGNLPSGETYIVPYEGEREDDPSDSQGILPLQLEDEMLRYRIRANRIVEVLGDGPHARTERREVEREPAYANVAELGLGVLAELGVHAVGEMLLDEKLGLHIAFGRSEHFGGTVGPDAFSAPDRVIHLDRVYIPEVQPRVTVREVDLLTGATADPLIRDGLYV